MKNDNIVDADFEVVSGPLRVGNEHPKRKGWFLTSHRDRHGDPIWHKPPGFLSRWSRRIGVWGYLVIMAIGIGAAIIGGR